MHITACFALLGALFADGVWSAGLYGKDSAVLQVSGKDFKDKIKLHDKASIVE